MATRNQDTSEHDSEIAALNQAIADREMSIAPILNSKSWRITAPLRAIRRWRDVLSNIWLALEHVGGWRGAWKRTARILRTQGIGILIARLRMQGQAASIPNEGCAKSVGSEAYRTLQVYVQEGFDLAGDAGNRHRRYVPKTTACVDTSSLPVKVIAFYLPQFHPFPENDAWWGKGFTEWTNVTKARPQYLGHHQPRLPGELGFYDLRLPEVMRQQIGLAKQYGVTGFCFHHYWFAGKRLMERPVNNFLADRTLDIDFCLCWANENWTRRWDGSESDVLIAQNHTPEDDVAFFEDILPALKDPRYIRVDGKPLLIVYRVDLFPDALATARRWRKQAREHGFPDLYLVAARSFDIMDPRPFGFDAAVEFPPHQRVIPEITYRKQIVNSKFSGKIYDYNDIARQYSKARNTPFVNFKTVMPSWDNEARKPGKGHVFDGAEPESYALWLDSAVRATLRNDASKRLVFINAWNEWAEGAHLEPDRLLGYAYLDATANVLRDFMN